MSGGYANSGLARFGANAGTYTPAAYTPMQFTPRTFNSGTTPMGQGRVTTGGGVQGGRTGITDPSGHGNGMGNQNPYTYTAPTGGSSSLGNGQTIYYGDGTNKGISPALARGIGMLGGGLIGSPIAGGVLGQVMSGAGASQASNLQTQPYSDARNSGGYADPSGSGSGYTPSTPSYGPGSQQNNPSYGPSFSESGGNQSGGSSGGK